MRRRLRVEDNSRSCELLGEILRQESQEESLSKQLRHVAHAQPPHQIEAMHFNRSHADVQLAGDFSIRHALSHQAEDFLLTRREGMRRIGPSGERSFFNF
jgi:hypothetical protein